MDVEDVSSVTAFQKALEKQKLTFQNAIKRKGQQPKDRKTLKQLIDGYMAHHVSQKMEATMGNSLFTHQSWLPPPYPPCVSPRSELKKIYLGELRLETHHRGRFVLLQVVTPPNRISALVAVMKDENNEGVLLQLYHQEKEQSRPASDIIRKNSVCIIKEPYYKIMTDGDYGLRVDHVIDILWLSEEDKMIPQTWRSLGNEFEKPAIKKKDEGNAAVKKGHFHLAIDLYTSALRCPASPEETHTIKLNRSLAYLKIGAYDAALEDANWLPENGEQSEKGLYRAARSLYELGRFQESKALFGVLLEKYSQNESARKELTRIDIRLREQNSGQYDFKSMYKSIDVAPPCLDNATYVGPVSIKHSPDRGRGLFTSRAVAAGELLLCEKAFSYSYATEASSESSNIAVLINTHTNRMVLGGQAALITSTIQLLLRNPSLMPAFTSLYHGDYTPVPETHIDELPVIDTFLVDRIISLNVFGCPRSSMHTFFSRDSPEEEERKKYHHSCGIFINATHINHSCLSNARRSFIGDMQIVRATRNIPPDAEIFFWYSAPKGDDRSTSKKTFQYRTALMEDMQDAFKAQNFPKVERLLTHMEKTYAIPAAQVPRIGLSRCYCQFFRLYIDNDEDDKAIPISYGFLTSLGYVIDTSTFEIQQWGLLVDEVVNVMVYLWTALACVVPVVHAQVSRAEEYARTAYRMVIGEDQTFDKHFGNMGRGEA